MNRRESSGEIVVAHRATEGAVNDVLTDASMVTSRTNPQGCRCAWEPLNNAPQMRDTICSE